MSIFKKALVAVLLTLGLSTPAWAIPLQLGLAIDGSGSVSSMNFDLQIDAYVDVLGDPSILPQDGSVEITIVQFSSSAQVELVPTVVTGATIGDVLDALNNMTQLGGSTCIACAIDLLTTTMAGSTEAPGDRIIIDVSTDGQENIGNAADSRDDALSMGVTAINCIGIGGAANCSFIGGTDAFSLNAASFAEFESSLRTKLEREITPNGIPEPGMVALFGLGLIGLAAARRRRV